MSRIPHFPRYYAAPMLAFATASAVMFAMAASGEAREGAAGPGESRQRAALAEGSIVVASRRSSAMRGAAVGTHVGRKRSEESSDAESDDAADVAEDRVQPAEQADGNGPFKVIIPGQVTEDVTIERNPQRIPIQPRQEAPANAAGASPSPAQTPARDTARSDAPARSGNPGRATLDGGSGSPVQTLVETGPVARPQGAAIGPEEDKPDAAARATVTGRDAIAPAAPAAAAAGPMECMAGCYETTSARVQRPPAAARGSAAGQATRSEPPWLPQSHRARRLNASPAATVSTPAGNRP